MRIMRNLGFILACFWVLGGCSSESFSVPVPVPETADADADASEASIGIGPNDGGGSKPDRVLPGCSPYSCKAGCGECDPGSACGSGGEEMCGTSNCHPMVADANPGSITCAGGRPALYECTPAAVPDFMPACTFVNTNAGRNWYCCK